MAAFCFYSWPVLETFWFSTSFSLYLTLSHGSTPGILHDSKGQTSNLPCLVMLLQTFACSTELVRCSDLKQLLTHCRADIPATLSCG